jgi:hypothetical protein
MGKRIVEMLFDDLTGEESDKVETITYALDGTSYEVELNPTNADKFRELFQDYIAVSRKVGGSGSTGGRSSRRTNITGRTGNKEELANIRAWLRENGHEVSDRGRIKAELVELYHAAH